MRLEEKNVTCNMQNLVIHVATCLCFLSLVSCESTSVVRTLTGSFQGHVVGVPESTTQVYEFVSIPL